MLKKPIWAFILSILIISPIKAQLKNEPILLGIFPYVSTGQLVTHHSTLRSQLNRPLDNSLSLVTAKNIDIYFENIKSYRYDLIFVPPHLAQFAQDKLDYQPLVMTTHQIRGVFLVAADSPFQSISDIENATLSMIPEKALLHQIALIRLAENGLVNGENITINPVKTHSNAIYNLLMQDSQVALTGIQMWHKLPAEKKRKLRQIAVTKNTAGFVVLAKPGLNTLLTDKLRQLFLSFKTTPDNKPYIFQGFKDFEQSAVDSMKIYTLVFE